jgi:hypothetical protein
MGVKQCATGRRPTGRDSETPGSISLAALGRSMSACLSSGYVSSECAAALRLHFPAAQVVRYNGSTAFQLLVPRCPSLLQPD